MKMLLAVLVACTYVQANGQTIQDEINRQVWKPFIESYNNHDTDGFMAVHSKEVIRSPRDANQALNWNQYREQMKLGDLQEKNSKSNRQLELRFTERIANENSAMEVGIYKGTSTDKEGNVRTFYGRFHVALRKENGTWKILVDTDSSEGRTIGEKDFLKALPME
jgi:ketosteroid isomerase-like protein